MKRRSFLKAGLGLTAAWLAPSSRAAQGARVVIIGGGFGGATCAAYLKRFLPGVQITLIEPRPEFVMCPMSNRVIAGRLRLADLSRPYDGFVARHGLRWVKAAADAIDPERREVAVGKERIGYDRLVVAPGVDFVYDGIGGLESEAAREALPHAWKAGPQTLKLRNQLTSMPDGGVFALVIPKAPFRCPPGPYERASLIAHHLQLFKPRAKILVFDANPQILAKKDLFEAVWKTRYPGLIEYVPNATLKSVDVAGRSLEFEIQGRQKADVINLIPPQTAGSIARQAGLATADGRWCKVDFLSYESTAQRHIHVLGDAIASAPGMPKSGHMANQEGKVCAAAIAAQFLELPAPPEPIIANTCYSFVSQTEAIHVAAVFRYDKEKRLMVAAPGAGGLSKAPSTLEALHAMAWATNILDDTLS